MKDMGDPVVRVTSGECNDVWLSEGVRTATVQFRVTRLCMDRRRHVGNGGAPREGDALWYSESSAMLGNDFLKKRVIARYCITMVCLGGANMSQASRTIKLDTMRSAGRGSWS